MYLLVIIINHRAVYLYYNYIIMRIRLHFRTLKSHLKIYQQKFPNSYHNTQKYDFDCDT